MGTLSKVCNFGLLISDGFLRGVFGGNNKIPLNVQLDGIESKLLDFFLGNEFIISIKFVLHRNFARLRSYKVTVS